MEHQGEDRGGAPLYPAKEQQRWEAVFRRERKPVSFDRFFSESPFQGEVYVFQEERCLFFLVEKESIKMKQFGTRKLCYAGILCAVAVVGSFFYIPVFGSKCVPVQHMVNILCAVLLGPFYGVGVAFCASLIRNLLGIGSLMAFPGSMFGALLCGLMFWKTKNIPLTLLAEVFGTAILGGLCAYPVAILFLWECRQGRLRFYAYVIPFLISTAGGAILSGILLGALRKTGILKNGGSQIRR